VTDDPKREPGELRVPELPDELRPPESAEAPPQLPVLSEPVSRRRRHRRGFFRFGLGVWLGLLVVAMAAAGAALLLAQPSGDRSAGGTTTTGAGNTHKASSRTPAGPFAVSTVSQPAAVLAAVGKSGAVLLGDKVAWLVGGSPNGKPVDTIARVALPAGKAANEGHFEEPLAEAGFAGKGNTLYLAGGYTGEKYATAVLRLTPPNGTATVITRLPVAVRGPSAALLGDKLYVAGGRTASGPTRSLLVVDLGTGKVKQLVELPAAAAGGTLVAVGGNLYLLAGKHVFTVDPATGRTKAAGTLPAQLRGAVSLGNGSLVTAHGRAWRLRAR
jgi:hypothetical protein